MEKRLLNDFHARPLAAIVVAATLLVCWAAGCQTYEDRIGYVAPPPAPPPLSPSDNSTVDAGSDAALCAASECPAPYATCGTSQYRCDKNLDSDNNNCGQCGLRCPGAEGSLVETVLHADWRCSSGACAMSCMQGFTDCNGSPGDGCEVNTTCDPNNCGGCGIKCADGVECINGGCGCPMGLTQCEPAGCGPLAVTACKDLMSNDQHCGGCGIECPLEDDVPPHTYTGCLDGKCGELKCEQFYEDCNQQKRPDGCEINVGEDPNNCGACGFTCQPGQTCWEGQCICPPGAQRCEVPDSFGGTRPACFYVDVDPFNCGACGRRCPAPSGGAAACRDGRCLVECLAGTADCDDDVRTGCETATDSDPNNCGGCGIKCDIAAGQPCIRGQCALAPCPEAPVQ